MSHILPHSVMVVTDEETVSDHIAVVLQQAGYRSSRAATAVEALQTLTTGKPELIFVDTSLPGMDSLDLCRMFKDNVSSKDIPVVMLSRTGEFFDEVFGCLVGAEACLSKPFAPEAILDCVQRHCHTPPRQPWAVPATMDASPLSSVSH